MAANKKCRNRRYTASAPWSRRWVNDIHGHDPRPEQQLAAIEAQQADAMGTKTCDCGSTAYYRPGVGAFQCPNCRALYVRGEWIK